MISEKLCYAIKTANRSTLTVALYHTIVMCFGRFPTMCRHFIRSCPPHQFITDRCKPSLEWFRLLRGNRLDASEQGFGVCAICCGNTCNQVTAISVIPGPYDNSSSLNARSFTLPGTVWESGGRVVYQGWDLCHGLRFRKAENQKSAIW